MNGAGAHPDKELLALIDEARWMNGSALSSRSWR
jgi:hypothetical protein